MPIKVQGDRWAWAGVKDGRPEGLTDFMALDGDEGVGVVGEVNLEDFEISHTKDEINWDGLEEELVEEVYSKSASPSWRLRERLVAARRPTTG